MSKYTFRHDHDAANYCDAISATIQKKYKLNPEDTLKLINEQFAKSGFLPGVLGISIYFHETPEYWADFIVKERVYILEHAICPDI